jgi:predicted phage tail protein
MNNDTNVNSNNFVQVATVTTTFYSIANDVLPGITYQFKITATNNLGTSLQSAVGAALAASVPAQPAAPTLLSQDSTQITITWIAPDSRGLPIINFEVNWDEGTGSQPRTVISTVGNTVFYASTSLQPLQLIPGANYIFSIRAINSLGFSPYG